METAMPRRSGLRYVVLIIGMLLLAGIVTVALLRDRIVNYPQWQVSVMGTGRVAYTPDEALVTVGVQIDEAPSADAALTELTTRINQLLPALRALGIPKSNITLHNYSLYPTYGYPEGGQELLGYSANQQVVVEVMASSTLSEEVSRIIDTAGTAGANQILGVQFTVSNVDELRQQAVIMALQDAQAKAEETAAAAGIRLKGIVGWWENQVFVPGKEGNMYYNSYGYGGGYGGDMVMREEMMASGVSSIPLGKQEIVIELSVNYLIK